MFSIITGAITISLLHAMIPNHWLPVIAIGRKEGWSLKEITGVTLITGLSHVLSTLIIGLLIGIIGKELSHHIDEFTGLVAPAILILMGFYFIAQHYRHHHFHIDKTSTSARSKRSVIIAMSVAMFLSPCMEIEAYFLLAGSEGWDVVAMLALIYAVVSLSGMLIWVRIVYKGFLKLDWHKWEHNAGIITGLTLVLTGVIAFFIH